MSSDEAVVGDSSELQKDNIEIRVHTEATFEDGDVVPTALWHPFFEGKLDKEASSALEILEAMLQNDGDFVYLKGSTVQRILYGIYPYDKEKKTIPAPVKSDLDLVVPNSDIYNRAENNLTGGTDVQHKYVSKTIKNKNTEVGLIALENLKQMHTAGLLELEAWAETLDDVSKKSAYLKKIDALRSQLASGDIRLLDAAFLHEAVSLKIERIDGNLVSTVVDASNLLTNQSYLDLLDSSRAAGNPVPPFKFFENPESTVLTYLEALQEFQDIEFTDSVFPIMALSLVNRVIKADTQDHMFFSAYYEEATWQQLYGLCERIHNGDSIFHYTDKVQQYYSNKGLKASESLFVPDVQAGFLRGCKNDPLRAYEMVFQDLPLGFIFSEDVHAIFEEMHTPENRGAYVGDAYKEFSQMSDAAKAKYRWGALVRKELDYHAETPVTVVSAEGAESIAKFPTYGESFTDINEVFSTMFASFNWDVVTDASKMQEVVDNWYGIWDQSIGWALNPEVADFKTELNLDKIKTRVVELRNKYANLFE